MRICQDTVVCINTLGMILRPATIKVVQDNRKGKEVNQEDLQVLLEKKKGKRVIEDKEDTPTPKEDDAGLSGIQPTVEHNQEVEEADHRTAEKTANEKNELRNLDEIHQLDDSKNGNLNVLEMAEFTMGDARSVERVVLETAKEDAHHLFVQKSQSKDNACQLFDHLSQRGEPTLSLCSEDEQQVFTNLPLRGEVEGNEKCASNTACSEFGLDLDQTNNIDNAASHNDDAQIVVGEEARSYSNLQNEAAVMNAQKVLVERS